MREFVLPFKPEELLAQPTDARLWAADLPPVDEWSPEEAGSALDTLIGRLLSTHGSDLAEDETFSLIFALLQAWARLDDGIRARVVDLLTDSARRQVAAVGQLRKATGKHDDQAWQQSAAREARTVAKVAVFFLRWIAERVLRQNAGEAAVGGRGRGRGKGGRRGAAPNAQEPEASAEELREAQKTVDRQRAAVLGELADILSKGGMPWLWSGDPGAWQQVAQKVSDAGFLVLDSVEFLKQRETRQLALRCITEPLLQEGHQHSNLLVATVSKLMHGLRGGESNVPFAADALVFVHSTPLPRLMLVELTQHCNPSELASQGAFQRALGSFLVAVAERLPHVVLANISVLLPLLDVDCYPLRNAIVESIGQLLSTEGRKLPSGARCGGTDTVLDAGEDLAADKSKDTAEVQFTIATATKQDLLETLLARSLDKSVWVRYRVLQTLTSLASNTRVAALPRDHWARVLEIATRRMQDHASSTRKAAMQLVRTLIEFHPFGPALQGSGDEKTKAEHLLREVACRLNKLQAEDIQEASIVAEDARFGALSAAGEGSASPLQEESIDANEMGCTDDHSTKRSRLKKKTLTDQTISGEIERCLAEADEGGGDRAEERNRQREALKRMQDCYAQRLRFVELLDAAEARLRCLLVSRTVTDVTEAIGVVVELRLRGVPAAARAFDQVLGLVWSRQASIKDAAVEAFYRMHLEGRTPACAVHALLEMYQEGCSGGSWTYTHLASVQELIQQAAEKELIEPSRAIPEVVAALRGPICPMALRTLTALGAASGSQLAAVLPQISKLMGPGGVAVGAGPTEQLERSRLLCQLLQRLLGCAGAPLSGEAWDHIWALCRYASHTVVRTFAHAQIPPQWFGAAQAAMDLSFDISVAADLKVNPDLHCPDKLWEQILGRMLCSILNQHGSTFIPPLTDAASTCEVSDMAQRPAKASTNGDIVPVDAGLEVHRVASPQLAGVVFLGGHLALRMLVFLEGLQTALKRKRLADEDARATEHREKTKTSKKGKSAHEADEGCGEAASLGMAGQEEREADAFAELAEQGLLYGHRSFLDRIKPLVFSCLLNPALRKDPVLRRVGAISLCKFMTVSKRFCEENLQILFSVLFSKGKDVANPLLFAGAADAQDAPHDVAAGAGCSDALFEDLTLRQSLLVAVGDLLFRHPNVVEPWSGRLYATLSGPVKGGAEGAMSSELRFTALLVLTHLVLNDMMKPRAVLLVRVLWLTACSHDPTARVARILFQELSKRSTNVVYNLLPEIIARLPEHQGSAGHVGGGAEERVRYIMQFVEKEKHVEGLIEKLTLRLEQTANLAGVASLGSCATVADDIVEGAGDVVEDAAPPIQATETISCLSHALGAMHYTDRCILRLHDTVVIRKALHTAISYHSITRECLLGLVEKARRPRSGKEKGATDGPAGGDPEANSVPAEGGIKSGTSAAAAAALDAIEQTVNGLAQGKDDMADQPKPIVDGEASVGATAPAAPATSSRAGAGKVGRGGKRKPEHVASGDLDPDNPGFDEDEVGAKVRAKKSDCRGRGRGRERGKARGQAAEEKENRPDTSACRDDANNASSGDKPLSSGAGTGPNPKTAGKKRRTVRSSIDDDDCDK